MWKHSSVRIIVDLDEDLLSAVEERRTASKSTGQVLADLARQALRPSPATTFATDPSLDGSSLPQGDERARSLG